MKMNKVFITLVVVSLVLAAGCSDKVINEGNKIVVEQRVGETNKYEFINEINADEEVQNVKNILDKIKWENVVIDMTHPADYKFHFEDTNKKYESKELIYHLWISPNKDKVELSIEGESKYIQLSTKKSEELFKIIAGQKSVDQPLKMQ